MRYLLKAVDTYRVPDEAAVEALHDELLNDSHFTLAAFSYKTKYIKQKGEVIDEYQLVTAKKLFNEEKDPSTSVGISYTMEF